MPAKLDTLIPMLSVSDLKRTTAFYCDRLGCRCINSAGGSEPVWCMLERDGVRMMFNQPPEVTGTERPQRARDFQIYYFYPDDVVSLHAELERDGLPVTGLRVTAYCMREFELRDPDGYWLWFGQYTTDPPTECE